MPFQPIRSVTSQTQADEISLLLQSLGIEAQVFQAVSYEPPVRTLWIVLVDTSQFAKAQQILAEEDTLLSPVSSVQTSSIMRSAQSDFSNDLWWLLSLVLINIGIWWIMEQQGGSQQRTTLLQFGAITSPLLSAGEWWRLVTALFVHIGIRHLVANMAVLLALGALTLPTWGPGRFFFVYVLSGILGNLAGFAFGSGMAVKAGASGAILGLLGALAGTRLQQLSQPISQTHLQPHLQPHLQTRLHSRFKRWHIIAMVLAMYSFVGGVQHPTTDHIAHFGGLIGGILVALFLPQFSADQSEGEEERRQSTLGLLAGGVCMLAWLYAALTK